MFDKSIPRFFSKNVSKTQNHQQDQNSNSSHDLKFSIISDLFTTNVESAAVFRSLTNGVLGIKF